MLATLVASAFLVMFMSRPKVRLKKIYLIGVILLGVFAMSGILVWDAMRVS